MSERIRVIVFSCNWNAYSGMESAAVDGRTYAPEVRPIRVACLGRLHPGLILKAFAHGASGVMMLGCPPGQCHHDFGYQKAQEVHDLCQKLIHLLGYRGTQLRLDSVAADDGEGFARKMDAFLAGLIEDSVES